MMTLEPRPRPCCAAPSWGRPGFTLTEVLVAVMISAFGLAALGGMVSMISKRSRDVDAPAMAALLAAERLNAFRGQGDGSNPNLASAYASVGGAFYAPPTDATAYNPATDARRFNVTAPAWGGGANGWSIPAGGRMNFRPLMFCREFLYEPTPLQLQALVGTDTERMRNRSMVVGTNGAFEHALRHPADAGSAYSIKVAANEIPPTPSFLRFGPGANQADLVALVEPAPTTFLATRNLATIIPAGGLMTAAFARIPMPRANPNTPDNTPVGNLRDPRLKYVREVWCQMNYTDLVQHPRGNPVLANGPNFVLAAPNSVVVTVRVYKKHPQIVTYAEVAPAVFTQANLQGGTGPGYDPRLPPMSELSSVFAGVVTE